MNRSSYYKNMFLIGAIWNLGAAIPAWLGIIFLPNIVVSMFGLALPAVLFPYHAMFWFIVAFGVGYFIVSRDITKNHGIVIVGIVAKTVFFIDTLVTFATGQAGVLLLLCGITDMIFVGLFVEFLLYAKKGSLNA